MTKFKTLIATAAFAASLVGIGSQAAQASDKWQFWVHNDTQHAIWITVYTGGDETGKVDWFCVNAQSYALTKTNNAYYLHNYVYVRGEIKAASNSCAVNSNKWDLKNNGMSVMGSGNEMITFSESNANAKPTEWTGWH
jgi:hypothetical protein